MPIPPGVPVKEHRTRRRKRPTVTAGAAVVVLLLVLGLPASAGAQAGGDTVETDPDGPPILVPRISEPIVLDGVVDDPAWDRLEPLPMTMFAPTFGGQTTERTEVRIAHDDEYLYVSGRMYDSDPSGIRTNTFYRNTYSGDDLLAVVLDSYNDRETAVWFSINPAGARSDRTVSNDANFDGGMPMNWDWNAHWDVATTQTDEGWFAEMRIPLSSLGFQVRDGEVTMGLIVYRFIARKNERQIFPAISPRWGGLAFAKPSQARRVRLRDVRQSTPVYVTPYSVAGLTRIPELTDAPGGALEWSTDSDPTTEVGLDLQFSPFSNLTLDLTVNTDFAQVEADDQQINLTRFPLFFPEKRQFFQERSSTFQFNAGGGRNRLFHSRRIGLVDGEIARIYGGARAVGRLGGTDFGLLSMQVASPAAGGSENATVLRVSQEILNPWSSVGAMVTSRLGPQARDNVAYGLDATFRPFGDEWLTMKWAQTFDEGADQGGGIQRGLAQARWERIQDEGISYSTEMIRVGRDYHPGLGFQDRRDFLFGGGHLQYKRFAAADSPLRSWSARAETGHFLRRTEGGAESRRVQPRVELEFKGGTQIRTSGDSRFESVLLPFTLAGVEIPAGEYWFHQGELTYQRPRSSLLRGDVTLTAGSFYDGTRIGLAFSPTWTQSKHLELGAGYEVNRLEFADRDQSATTHLAQLRVQTALNTQVSLSALAQYSNVAELGSVNARFRYHFREGTDLWIVYNEGFHTERDLVDVPRLPLSSGRTLMVKYTHTFIW
jgi:hypothetical protein